MMNKIFFTIIFIFLTILTACNSLDVGNVEQKPDLQNTDEEKNPAQIIALEEDRTNMRVLWTISDYVLSTNFAGQEADAKGMIFTPLDMTDTQIIFSDEMCIDTVFVEESVVLSEYLTNTWQETTLSLGIESEKEGTLIRTNCELFGFREYLRLIDGRLIVPYNNVFYFFEPNVIY